LLANVQAISSSHLHLFIIHQSSNFPFVASPNIESVNVAELMPLHVDHVASPLASSKVAPPS